MEKLIAAIEQIAQKIGTTVDYLWPKTVTAFLAYEVASAAIALVVLGLGLWLLPRGVNQLLEVRKRRRAWENREWDEDDPAVDEEEFVWPIIKTAMGGVLLLFGSITTAAFLPSALRALISPEGAMVLSILGK